MKIMLSEILTNNFNFETITKEMIRLCANDIQHRKSMVGVDTVLLKSAVELNQTYLESQVFWNVYQTIANQFEKVFKDFNSSDLPFKNDSEILSDFLFRLWRSFFLSEINSLIKNHPNLAVFLLKAETRPEHSLELMNQIDEILNERYS